MQTLPPGPHQGALRLAAGLGLTPLVVGLAALILPHMATSEAVASAVVFAGATSTALAGLALACSAPRSVPAAALRGRLLTAALAIAVLAAAASCPLPGPWSALLIDAALVAAGWAIGGAIGNAIEDPGHLLPACVVVACADLMSTLSPSGPTHAIAASERALALAAVSFPVPGTNVFAPALGIGDLVFVALLFAAAARHRLSYARMVALTALGIAAAGSASAWLGMAVPALVPVAFAVVSGLKPVRTLRPKDRRVAAAAIALALGLVTATLAARLLAA